MELTGVAEAARREEMRIPECLWEKWFTEATSGLNDWLGSHDGNAAALGRNAEEADGKRIMVDGRAKEQSVDGRSRKDEVEWAFGMARDRRTMGVIEMMTAREAMKLALLGSWRKSAGRRADRFSGDAA